MNVHWRGKEKSSFLNFIQKVTTVQFGIRLEENIKRININLVYKKGMKEDRVVPWIKSPLSCEISYQKLRKVKVKLIGNWSQCRWCHYSTVLTRCNQHLFKKLNWNKWNSNLNISSVTNSAQSLYKCMHARNTTTILNLVQKEKERKAVWNILNNWIISKVVVL